MIKAGGIRLGRRFAALAVVTVLVAVASLFVGAGDLSAAQVFEYLLHGTEATTPSITNVDTIVMTQRLPRAVAAIVVGCALGVAGALLQSATRNPLADTGLLGVNQGAALGVVIGMTATGASAGLGYLPWAFGGALAAAAVVLLLAGIGNGGGSPLRLLLAGAALSATLTGLATFLLLRSGRAYQDYRYWVLGSLSGSKLATIAAIAPAIGIGVVLAIALVRPLSAIALGDDSARALGHRPAVTRLLAGLSVTLLAAASIALAGPISFLGLVSGYVARHMVGPRIGAQIVAAASTGALVLLVADICVRLVNRPFEGPVAGLLAVIGAPLLIFMVRSKRLNLLGATDTTQADIGSHHKPAIDTSLATNRVRPDDSVVVRWRGFSALIGKRAGTVSIVLIALVVLAAIGCTVAASHNLSPFEVVSALFGEGKRSAVLKTQEFVLPRVLVALAVGGALGLAGCLTQTLARNRLATPDFLGVNDGATLLVLFTLMGTVNASTLFGVWWAGPLGAILITGVILLLAGGLGTQGYRVLVVGLGMATLTRSVVEFILARGDFDFATLVFTWSQGSLDGRGLESVAPLAIGLLLLVPVLLVASRRLRMLRFSSDIATSVGVHVGRTQLLVLILAVMIAGLAVGVGGPIGFIALPAPILASTLTGPARPPLVTSALIGALLVLLADTLGQVALPDQQVVVGSVTSILGGPFLLWVLLRTRAHT